MRWISSVNFLHTTKSRLPDPSEICALEFKGEFLQFRKLVGFKRLSASVGRFSNSPSRTVSFGPAKKDRHPNGNLPLGSTRSAHSGADVRIGSSCNVGYENR